MECHILVPSGIGDFSWLWSKLSTTPHKFNIEYIGGYPDRQRAFLNLLPKDKISSFRPNVDYRTKWDENHELICYPRDPGRPPIKKARCLNDLLTGEFVFVECNTHLEAGNRLEDWWKADIPATDFHYPINGVKPFSSQANYFVVNFSSYGTKRAWGYYEPDVTANVVKDIAKHTGWIPVFVGGEYDDYTEDVHATLWFKHGVPCMSLVGKTPELSSVIALLQQSRMYFGACSGLMVIANILNRPVLTYYPPFEKPPGKKLSGTWQDPAILYKGLFWEGADKDIEKIKCFLKEIL